MLLRKTTWFWKSGLAAISFVLIINIGRSTVSSAVKIANHPNSVPEVSSFVALISAVPVFPARRMSSLWAA